MLASLLTREQTVAKVTLISADLISPNPNQPRKTADPIELAGLAESIRVNGLLQPIALRKIADGYQLIAGERRYRACVLAGVRKIPSIVIDANDEQSAVFAVLENLQRQDLSFFEEAEGLSSLLDILNITQEQLASRLGKTQSSVANKIRLLKLSSSEKKIIAETGLTERHARALLKLENEEQRLMALKTIIMKQMNVAQTDIYIESIIENEDGAKKGKRIFLLKDIRLFMNTVNKAVDFMKKSGINVVAKKNDTGENIEYYIKIPKNK